VAAYDQSNGFVFSDALMLIWTRSLWVRPGFPFSLTKVTMLFQYFILVGVLVGQILILLPFPSIWFSVCLMWFLGYHVTKFCSFYNEVSLGFHFIVLFVCALEVAT